MNSFHEQILPLVLMGVLLVFSAFFSGTETALFSLSPDLSRRLRASRRTGSLMKHLHREPSELLTAILFGNLVVNILFFCTGAALSGRLGETGGGWAEAAGAVLTLFLIILFGEIVPKAVGITHPAAVLQFASPPLLFWFYAVAPFRRLVSIFLRCVRLHSVSAPSRVYLTAGELKELLDSVRHEPGFGSQEKEIFEDIINLSDIRVREIMVPRVRVLRKPLDVDRRELLKDVRNHEYSRVLIYRNNDDNPVGYISARDLFLDESAAPGVEPLLCPLVFVPETKRVDALLKEFMERDYGLVAVVDEYGGLAGIVTFEDLLAEVVGDFEPAPVEEIQQIDETTYRLNGQLSIRAWRELFTGFLPGQEVETLTFDTLGGLIISLLGRMPREGDVVFVRNLRLTVEAMHHRRIGTVLLHLQQPEEVAV